MNIQRHDIFACKDWNKGQFRWVYYKVTGIIHSAGNPVLITEDGHFDKLEVVMVEKELDQGEEVWKEISESFDILKSYVEELAGRKEIIFKG